MSLLNQIELLGISVSELGNLTDQDIIRIEKKLKMEVRLNQSLDINEVEKILKTLREHKKHLQLLFSPSLKSFRQILTSERGYVVINQINGFELIYDDEFSAFISASFHHEIEHYVERCLKEDHYLALHSFLVYRDLLNSDLLDNLVKKVDQKLIYITECIAVKASQLDLKIRPALNPYFYRCLNRLGGLQFELGIRRLLNTTIEHLKNKNLNFRVLYAMGSYEAVNDHVRDILAENKSIAQRYGIREIFYSDTAKKGRGGTYASSTSTSRKTNSGGGAWGGVGVIAFIVIMALRVILMTNRSNDSTPEFDFQMPEYINNEWVSSLEEAANNSSDLIFYENIWFIHTDTFKIISQRDISFDEDLMPYISNGSMGLIDEDNMVLSNETNRMLLVHVEGAVVSQERFLFMNPGDVDTIPAASSGLRFYTGEDPQIVTYIDEDLLMVEKFRFNDFDETDRGILLSYFELDKKASFFTDYEAHITEKGDGIELEIDKIDTFDEDILNQ